MKFLKKIKSIIFWFENLDYRIAYLKFKSFIMYLIWLIIVDFLYISGCFYVLDEVIADWYIYFFGKPMRLYWRLWLYVFGSFFFLIIIQIFCIIYYIYSGNY